MPTGYFSWRTGAAPGNRGPDFCYARSLDFFVDSGIRMTLADVTGGRCVRGNLFFAAPAGTWASGEYELAVGGGVGVRVPFEIE